MKTFHVSINANALVVQICRVRHGRDRMVAVQAVPITTIVVSSNPAHGEVYSTQLYVIKFVNDFRQICSFLRFPPPIKLAATI
jgi:hypothetical protein